MLLASIENKIHSHLTAIPGNFSHAAVKSGVISCVSVALITHSPTASVASAGIAILAVTIDALINPFFEEHFATSDKQGVTRYSVWMLTVKNITVITTSIALISLVVPIQPHLGAIIFIRFAINLWTTPCAGQPAHTVDEYWLTPKLF